MDATLSSSSSPSSSHASGRPSRAALAAIAANRFGLGARPDDAPLDEPADWLRAQLDPAVARQVPLAWRAQPDTAALAEALGDRRRALQQERDAKANAMPLPASPANAASQTEATRTAALMRFNEMVRDTYRHAVDARLTTALTTSTPFFERLVYFWSNHFAISIEKQPVTLLAGAFEMEAIRPHVLGRFGDMLVAVEQHPAMQIFLDQNASIGPDSLAAQRVERRNPGKRPGLNENLARETMELHTLGVRSGYTQNDVTEFARALTGWSIGGIVDNTLNGETLTPGQFVFRAPRHEPGTRTVLGKSYPQQGEDQALAVLADFAASPATAHHIAEKLARHFVADVPPASLINRLADAFHRSGGDLTTVYRVLIASPEAWHLEDVKFKTPWEWTVSAMRGLGWNDLHGLQAAPLLTQLGQQIWRPGSPAGFDDIAASWAAPDALMRRVEVAQRLSAKVGDRIDARTLGPTLLGPELKTATSTEVARAESAQDALALLLVSPDFLRR